jgi:type VI secretion system secreted protein Hcp
MASNIFLKLTDVTGESEDAKHGGEIEIESYSWGMHQSASAHAGGGGGGTHYDAHDMQCTVYASKATPVLMLKCAKGEHIAEGILTSRKAGGGEEAPKDFLIYTMKDIIVTNYNTGGMNSAAQMQESFSLSFAEIKMEYKVQEADGSLGKGTEATFNLKANTAA